MKKNGENRDNSGILPGKPVIRQVVLMEEKYNPKKIEPKWQAYWESTQLFKVHEDPTKEKYYLLEMFP
jgi:isoleucyl-tRNA synthetase